MITIKLTEKQWDALFSCAIEGMEERSNLEDKEAQKTVRLCDTALNIMLEGKEESRIKEIFKSRNRKLKANN